MAGVFGIVGTKSTDDTMKKNAIDLIITMVVDELSEDMQLPASELLPQFIVSKTGKLLYDESSKLWWSGPSDIAQLFKDEIFP